LRIAHFCQATEVCSETQTYLVSQNLHFPFQLLSKDPIAWFPDAYEKGKEIQGLDAVAAEYADRACVFHAGTAEKEGKIVTTGGRVLGVTGWGNTFDAACAYAYETVNRIHFEGAYSRKDIGYRVRAAHISGN